MTLEHCQRCASPPAASPGGGEADVAHACLFCQEPGGGSYVPLHFSRGEERPATPAAAPSGPGGESTEPLVARGTSRRSAPSRAGIRPATYSEALDSHRGCARCWLRWEEQKAELAAEAGRSPDLLVRCPVCDLLVDIRRTYDAVLCKPCQQAVLAKGGLRLMMLRWQARCWEARRIVGVVALCLMFGIQGLVSLLLWEICGQQLRNLGVSVTREGVAGRHHGDASAPGADPNVTASVVTIAAAAVGGMW